MTTEDSENSKKVEQLIGSKEKSKQGTMNMKENPVPWIGAMGTIGMFVLGTVLTWALGVQKDVLAQDARLRVLEVAHQELRNDVKEIKDNVLFMRFNQPAATTANSSGRNK